MEISINEKIKKIYRSFIEKAQIWLAVAKKYWQKNYYYFCENKHSFIVLTLIIGVSVFLTTLVIKNLTPQIIHQSSFFNNCDDYLEEKDDDSNIDPIVKKSNNNQNFINEPYSKENLRNGVFIESSIFPNGQKLFPKEVAKKIFEIRQNQASSPFRLADSTNEKEYLNTLLKLPWFEKTKENDDIEDVKTIINNSHLGMIEAKKEIIDFLSVRIFKKQNKKKSANETINALCLYGAPGTGKTTLSISIAKALHRPFQKISLTGINESFALGGLDRAYAGAKSGRIIQAIKNSGFNNPVILLDEIDKVSRVSLHGDPLAPLLEILDPAQNKNFFDKYLNLPFDVSNVLFILTANDIEKIPTELYDRIRVINIHSYCFLEKKAIAKNYAIPRILNDSGLNKDDIVFTDRGLDYLMKFSVFEGGMRGTIKRITTIIHGIITENNGNIQKIRHTKINQKEINKYCGFPSPKNAPIQKNTVGGFNALAVNSNGVGLVTPTFVTITPGNGLVKCVGISDYDKKHYGVNFTKGSCEVALTYIKKNYQKLKINPNKFNQNDFTIVFPWFTSGPSAGVGITACLVSALRNIPIRHDFAMTGEIRIDGTVGMIGGTYEKVTGAYDAGIRNIIIPYENYSDFLKIPKSYIKDAHIYFVKTFDEVLNLILE